VGIFFTLGCTKQALRARNNKYFLPDDKTKSIVSIGDYMKTNCTEEFLRIFCIPSNQMQGKLVSVADAAFNIQCSSTGISPSFFMFLQS
jgi:hypothetical protein